MGKKRPGMNLVNRRSWVPHRSAFHGSCGEYWARIISSALHLHQPRIVHHAAAID